MDRLTAAETARRAGVDAEYLQRLIDSGVINPAADGSFVQGDVRRTTIVHALIDAGIALEGL